MRNVMFAAFTLAIIGCSDQYAGRQELSGKVSLRGEAIKEGTISFDPLEGQDTNGFGQILKGEFKIPRQNGVKTGRYRVRISAGDGKTPANSEAGAPGGSTNIVSKELIPAEWNIRSNQEVTVVADRPNTLDFEIK
jgi:hypothetical protein